MTLPVHSTPAGPALGKAGADKPGSKGHSGDDAFGYLVRLPARSKSVPQKPGLAAEPTRLPLIRPAAKLEAAVGKVSGLAPDQPLDDGEAIADMPDPADANDSAKPVPDPSAAAATPEAADGDNGTSTTPPSSHGSNVATNGNPPQDTQFRSPPLAIPVPSVNRAAAEVSAALHEIAAASASPAAEMPGTKFPATPLEIIHLAHPAQQKQTALFDAKSEPQNISVDLLTAPPTDKAGQKNLNTPAKIADWKSEPVTIVAQQNIPAPVAQPTAYTASALVTLLAGDAGWRQAATPAFQPLAAKPGLSSAHSLKLQLHPAELGMVTASLRLTGEHLTVELRVENQDAFQRLNADSEIIVKSLRALGLDIDKVTVQQPQVASQAQARADGQASASSSGTRDQGMFGQADSGGAGTGGHQSGRSQRDVAPQSGTATSNGVDRSGGDIYI